MTTEPLVNGDAMVPKLLLTPVEAAHALGIGRSKLYELLVTGQIDSIHIGAARRITVAALNEFIDRQRQLPDLYTFRRAT